MRSIFEYIAFGLLASDNAAGQIDRLEEAIGKLDHLPEKYRKYDKEPWYSRGLIVFPVDNYLVFYIPNMEEKIVTVVRVMYGSLNVNSLGRVEKSALFFYTKIR